MHQFEWRHALERAKQRLRDLECKRTLGIGSDELPPLTNALVLYRDRIQVLKLVMGAGLLLSLCGLGAQEWRFQRLLNQLREKEYLIVPGAPEFMRLRPGFVPKESVYMFAEFVASQLGTFSYNTVQTQYTQIAEFMRPELKQSFLRSFEQGLQNLKELRVDEVFEFPPVRDFVVKNDERGPKYIVRVKGATRRYVEGTLRHSNPSETFTLAFRTTQVKPNRPWFFEIEELERLSSHEEDVKNIKPQSEKGPLE